MSNNFNYERLSYLIDKVNNQNATEIERKEMMDMLYKNKSITKNQYDNYLQRQDLATDILQAALVIGGIVLLGYLLTKLLK
jgi:hypothetical protein